MMLESPQFSKMMVSGEGELGFLNVFLTQRKEELAIQRQCPEFCVLDQARL